jgi:hypothetical protein
VSIFEGFEPESDDEDQDEDSDDDNEEESAGGDGLTEEERQRIEKLAIQDFPDDEPFEPEPTTPMGKTDSEPEDDDLDTGVQTSQLRHFVIQVCYYRSAPGDCACVKG